MSLELFFHPLSSFCHKALIALYETGTPFEPRIVNLGDADERAAFLEVWPIGKFPVLRDNARNAVIPESSIIIEYLAQYYPGGTSLVPADPDLARHVRASDRFFDLNVQVPMQKIVGDRIRPRGRTIRSAWRKRARNSQPRSMLSTATWPARRGPWARASPWPIAPPRPRFTTPTASRHSQARTNTPPPISRACRSGRPTRALSKRPPRSSPCSRRERRDDNKP